MRSHLNQVKYQWKLKPFDIQIVFLIHHKCKCDATCSKSIVYYTVGPSLNKNELAFTNRKAQKLNYLIFVHQVFLTFMEKLPNNHLTW